MNSTTPTPNRTALLLESLERLRGTIAPNVIFILLGLLALSLNSWTIFCIVRSKTLHTKCFALLACNAFVDLLMGCSYAAIGSTRLYRFYTGSGEVMSMWQCCGEASLITFSQTISLGMSAALVIDRLLATLVAHKYRTYSYKSITLPLLLSAFTFASAQSCVHISDSWRQRDRIVLTCGIEDTVSKENLPVLITIQLITSLLVIGGNCSLAYSIKKRRTIIHNDRRTTQRGQSSNTSNTVAEREQQQHQSEMRIFKTITVIVLMHILTHAGGRLILIAITAWTPDVAVQSLTSRYTRLLVVVNAAVHFLILYFTSGQFRSAVQSVVDRNSTAVRSAD